MNQHQELIQLGLSHQTQGRLREAEAVYRQILAQQPDEPSALQLLGIVRFAQDDPVAAIDLIRRAIAAGAKPLHEAYNNLGIVLRNVGRIDEAIEAFELAATSTPDHLPTLANLGQTLLITRRFNDAVRVLKRAAALKPDSFELQTQLGNAYDAAGRIETAVSHWRRALELSPHYVPAQLNLSVALLNEGRFVEAADWCRKLIAQQPSLANAHNNLANALIQLGKLDEGMAEYRRSVELAPDQPALHSNLLLLISHHPDFDMPRLLAEHRAWAARYAEPMSKMIRPPANDSDPSRRIRVGYVSADFRQHAVAHFIEPVLAHHDRNRFEIFCYSDVGRHNVGLEDSVTERIRALPEHWIESAAMSDGALIERIRADRIDVLIDLSLHTPGNRLQVFAARPAPVQMAYLGTSGTTGIDAIDYRITDAIVDPPGASEAFHVEKLIRLPRVFCCYRPPADAPAVAPPPAIERGFVTFGSFNRAPKMGEPTIAAWARVLKAVPSSRLLLKSSGLSDPPTQAVWRERFASHGIGERVDFAPTVGSIAEHLAVYDRVDIALDTIPYNGTTTTCEALWMGVPVVTWTGGTSVSRVSASLLNSVGLLDLVGKSADEFVTIAVALAGDGARRKQLRDELRERMRRSPLMDEAGITRELEGEFAAAWTAWQQTRR